jgi:hypothetical protein
VDARVWHQVSLELSDIDVKSTIETERRSQGRDNLGHEAVQVGVRGALNVERAAADVVDGFVVKHDGDIGVLEERVRGKNAIVWLNDGGSHLWGRVDAEAKLGLAAIVDRKALKKKRAKARTSAATNSVEAEETLKARAVIGELADAVEDKVHDFLANGVVATGIVVSGIFLSGDDLLRVVKLAVSAGADFIAHSGLEVDENRAWDVLASASFREERVEGVVAAANGLVRGHLAIRLDTVLEAVEFPAGITKLNAGLANVDRDDFTLGC